MKLLIDSFWRAAAYCLHPKVIALSLLPLAIGVALALGLGWLFWEPAVAWLRVQLDTIGPVDMALSWIEGFTGPALRAFVAPMMVVLAAAPVIVVLSVLLVAVLMTPAIVQLVAARRFPDLVQRKGAGAFVGAMYSLGCTLVALVAVLLSLPLWLVPPLVLVLPPLIWGWLTYKVMSFDTLAAHADKAERRALIDEHRLPLLGIGVITGYLGAAPSLIWAASVVTVVFAPFIIALSVWLYTLVFAFSALWFAHYLLAALELRRRREATQAAEAARTQAVTLSPVAEGVAATAPTAPAGTAVVPAGVGSAAAGSGLSPSAGAEVIDVTARPLPPAADPGVGRA